MSNQQLTLFQTFQAMRIFLDMYFQDHESADIATILGSLQLCDTYQENEIHPETWDPAAWKYWMNGVDKTLSDHKINLDLTDIRFTTELAYQCMQNYLELFYMRFHFEDLQLVLQLLHQAKHVTTDPVWQQWQQAIQNALNNSYEFK